MPRQPIPQRQPIGDSFVGSLITVDDRHALTQAKDTNAALVNTGSMTIRYGVPYLGKTHLAIVPGLLALDYGDFLTGDAAWEFLLKRSNLYPRAEVFGYRNDGRDDMVVVKALDLAAPIHVLAYVDEDTITPLARVDAYVAAENTAIPARMSEYLPRFSSIKAWLKEETDNA